PDAGLRVRHRRRRTRRRRRPTCPAGGRPQRPAVADLRPVRERGPHDPGPDRQQRAGRLRPRTVGRIRGGGHLLTHVTMGCHPAGTAPHGPGHTEKWRKPAPTPWYSRRRRRMSKTHPGHTTESALVAQWIEHLTTDQKVG